GHREAVARRKNHWRRRCRPDTSCHLACHHWRILYCRTFLHRLDACERSHSGNRRGRLRRLLYSRLLHVLDHVRGTWLDGELRSGSPAGAVAGDAADHLFDRDGDAGAAASQLATCVLGVLVSVLHAYPDVCPHHGRDTAHVADPAL